MARKSKKNTEEVVVTMTTEEVQLPIAENPEAGQPTPEVVYDNPQNETPEAIAAEIKEHMDPEQDLSLVTPEQLEEVLESYGIDPKEPEAATITATPVATDETTAPEVATTDTTDSEAIADMEEAMMAFIETVTKSVAAPVRQPETAGTEVTVNDLADEFGIQAKSLRSRLRKSGYKKAGKTWGWSPDSPELAEIRAKFTRKLEPAQPVPTPPVSVTE